MNRGNQIDALIRRIGSDTNAATELLRIAGEYLESGKPLPMSLAKFLGKSFRRSMEQPSESRANALVFELGFTAPAKQGAPSKLIEYTVVQDIVAKAFANGANPSEREINKRVAKRFGMSSNTASKHTKAEMLVPKMLRNSGLGSLIPPRNPNKA
jgi:hypothetical protein